VRPRKVPLRTCVGCGTTRPKRELRRVVRTPDGQVVFDPTGKRAGRGAYVCESPECLELAIKHKKLERALSVTLAPEVVAALQEAVRRVGA
jgi:predicted RNA-binding protein YlxR (DUF448 family)